MSPQPPNQQPRSFASPASRVRLRPAPGDRRTDRRDGPFGEMDLRRAVADQGRGQVADIRRVADPSHLIAIRGCLGDPTRQARQVARRASSSRATTGGRRETIRLRISAVCRQQTRGLVATMPGAKSAVANAWMNCENRAMPFRSTGDRSRPIRVPVGKLPPRGERCRESWHTPLKRENFCLAI